MPLPVPLPDESRLRFALVVNGVEVPTNPTVPGAASLTREPGEGADAGAFYYRDKLSEVEFSGPDFELLYALETSPDRCQPIGLVLDTRPHALADWHREYTGTFTCNECKPWGVGACTVRVNPTTDDPYRRLLEAYDLEYNILAVPDAGATKRRQVTATLASLAAGIKLETLRIDSTQEADFVGIDGWSVFLRDTSWVSGDLFTRGVFRHNVLLLRYRLRNVPMTPPVPPATGYTAVDMSGTGWAVLLGTENTTNHTIDYVKAPEIAGFKPYKIGTYNDWNDPLNPGRTNFYGAQLLVTPPDVPPSAYGYSDGDYVSITNLGANNDNTRFLDLRRTKGTSVYKSLWWRFGDFRFGRCFRLRDGLYELLRATIYGPIRPDGTYATPAPALRALLPPSADLLGDFLTADVNPATGDTGPANEVPRLLLSAASDVKRYGASEAATRVLISLKQFLADLMALYDCGWFVDPVTGWLRIEHRAYLETQQAAGAVLDLTVLPKAILPAAYGYRTERLPRYEELTVANAQTQDLAGGFSFAKAALDYGAGGCTVGREGQNRATSGTARLTGDVAAGVLSGEAVPDNALFVLAPDETGRLADANRALAPTSLLLRYHRRGRAGAVATVGQHVVRIESLRPLRTQEGLSVPGCSLADFGATVRYTTDVGRGPVPNGQLAKAELALNGGGIKLSLWLPVAFAAGPPPEPRQFSDQFSSQFA